MTKYTTLEVPDGQPLAALRGFLRGLLEQKIVDALLVPQPVPPGDSLVQTLVRDAALLERADPIYPLMPVQSARLVSRVSAANPGGKVGVVLKPCELRATVELAKLKQVDMAHIVTISLDCLGTYEVTDFVALARALGDVAAPSVEALTKAKDGAVIPHDGYQFRPVCRICEQPVPTNADIAIGLLGVDTGREILIESSKFQVPSFTLERATWNVEHRTISARSTAINRLVAERTAARDARFAELRAAVTDVPGLLAQFATCLRCYNCMEACPICYCKECIFKTATFDHTSESYMRWAGRKGAVRMPTDTLLFHLTRLNHMVASCVGCGACTNVCPSDIPVGEIFRTVGQKVQAMFDYVPGRSLDEPLPLATFKENELLAL
jgi:formate dehydrogenase subunit beta